MILNGNNLLVLVGASGETQTAMACATTCTLNVNQDSIEASCKSESNGKWVSSIPGKVSWDISTDNLYDPTFTSNSFDKLLSTIIADADGTGSNEFDIVFQVVNDDAVSGDVTAYTGKVQLTDISLNGPVDETSTYSANFKGVGKLTQSTKT